MIMPDFIELLKAKEEIRNTISELQKLGFDDEEIYAIFEGAIISSPQTGSLTLLWAERILFPEAEYDDGK